ncbi:UNKNOWN [Stylonychia lemnae]|uniref:Uncharacterized protein n=1 Tax=Stylonychia lemnae TaxID=5949 RepID=A0A078B191_STYLE|nr:UNKNOWN [Stylonychia lemnae]|eukprot:CDW86893.1 UNKNOWN [Stylonychia lemnae]
MEKPTEKFHCNRNTWQKHHQTRLLQIILKLCIELNNEGFVYFRYMKSKNIRRLILPLSYSIVVLNMRLWLISFRIMARAWRMAKDDMNLKNH